MTVPTISGVTVAPTSMSAVDSFYVTCGFAVQPDMAFCEVGDAPDVHQQHDGKRVLLRMAGRHRGPHRQRLRRRGDGIRSRSVRSETTWRIR